MVRKMTLKIFAGTLILMAFSLIQAQITVVPIRVFLDPGKKSADLKITNEKSEKMNIQVRAVAWSQDPEGKDKFDPTEDIVFFPKIFEVEPGKDAVIRVGYQGDWPETEKNYRLFIRELPITTPDQKGLSVAVRLGIPVFISPKNQNRSAVIESVRLDDQKISVNIKNTGNVHYLAEKIQAIGMDSTDQETFKHEITGWYVLSGVSRIFSIEISEEEALGAEKVLIKVSSGKDILEKTFMLSKE
ncbi:MAG: molecular chaperone [Candidatus Aminicenantes bacterium]|nr:MAG: molecular chaperone [Candidatus Aminicenantes bacterium]